MSKEKERPWTMSVPEAGRKYFDLGRSGSYRAAQTGEIPTLWINGKLRALPRVLERRLDEAGTNPPPQE
jgi:hypothetical protein